MSSSGADNAISRRRLLGLGLACAFGACGLGYGYILSTNAKETSIAMKRELIYMDAKSSKFWNIEQEGAAHTVTYGRIGTAGQSSTKSFESAEAAQKDAEKLIKEKMRKGYVEAGDASSDAELLPLVAFSHVLRKDEISSNAGTFIGRRVVDFDRSKPFKSDVVYRFRTDWDGPKVEDELAAFLATDGAKEVEAIVIGAWQGDDSSNPPDEVLKTLIDAKDRLGKLKALYLGDITYEENEMSWIYQTDLSGLLQAFPSLQLLRTRGGESLAFSRPEHAGLRALALETGGLDASVVKSLGTAKFPKLEYLELWLGTSDYGANVSVADLRPILLGETFPKLKYLGLRNSEIADELAVALVDSPIIKSLETLDLSLGTLSDVGGKALLKLESPSLKRLVLHHHYLSDEVAKKLQSLSLTVDTSNPSGMETDEEDRYVAVGE